jgi:hypothetical protein
MWYIQRLDGTLGWVTMPGRRYKTEAAAAASFARMETRWDADAVAGTIHPSWHGRFRREHRLIHACQTLMHTSPHQLTPGGAPDTRTRP